MQLLCFTLGDETYAIASRSVIEVVPLLAFRPLAAAPAGVRGVFVHRGRLAPLVDLACLLGHEPLRDRLSTRVIIVAPPPGPAGRLARLGVAAENVLSLCDDAAAEDRLPPIADPTAPYLGACLRLGGRTIQCLDVDHLLPPAVWRRLAAEAGETPLVAPAADRGRQS
jgi:chemotaxis-related protein WspB